MAGVKEIAHQIPHILVALIIVGVLGSAVLVAFFGQVVDNSISPAWVIIPLVGLVSIGILTLKTALGDRD